MSTILVYGGYGGFGARLSCRLAEAGHDVVVAGRSLTAAEAFCARNPSCRPIRADRIKPAGPVLALVRPDLVIDAAGPFQTSGYDLAEACIAAATPYLDLADGRTFVNEIRALDGAASRAGVAVISGASTVPALTGAVTRHLARGIDKVSAVEIALSAANRACGGAASRAVLSYLGKPVALWRGRRLGSGFGGQEARRERFALPDGTTLGRRLVVLAEVPDLDLLPARLSGSPAVTFRAGTDVALQTLGLWLASWPVRWGWLSSLDTLTPLLLRAQRLTAWLGSGRSGMVVRFFGSANGLRIERRWTLLALDGQGAEIPTLAAAILAGRILSGEVAPGARDAGLELELPDFDGFFADLSIRHSICERQMPKGPHARAMGLRFAALAPGLRSLHDALRDGGAGGRLALQRGNHPIARILAALSRLPPSGRHDLYVRSFGHAGGERWTREISGRQFTSDVTAECDRVVESFGPFRFWFDLVDDGGDLRTAVVAWSFLRWPIPMALAPIVRSRAYVESSLLRFDASVDLPLAIPLLRLKGWLRLPCPEVRSPSLFHSPRRWLE